MMRGFFSNSAEPGALPDFRRAFSNMEGPIDLALNRARVANHLAETIADIEAGKDGLVACSEATISALLFMVFETMDAVAEIESQWLDTHNVACEAEARR